MAAGAGPPPCFETRGRSASLLSMRTDQNDDAWRICWVQHRPKKWPATCRPKRWGIEPYADQGPVRAQTPGGWGAEESEVLAWTGPFEAPVSPRTGAGERPKSGTIMISLTCS